MDINYQSSINTVSATWHGFEDLGAGVINYWWCVGNTSLLTDCNLTGGQWLKMGLLTTVNRRFEVPLLHGKPIT